VSGRGHPRSFKDENEFKQKFNEYLDKCKEEEKLANIAGFCWYCGIHRDTFYAQEEYYSDAFKQIQSALEDAALNHSATSMGIFYLKNKFNYRDKQEIESVNHNLNDDVTGLSDEELDKMLEKLKK